MFKNFVDDANVDKYKKAHRHLINLDELFHHKNRFISFLKIGFSVSFNEEAYVETVDDVLSDF